MLRIKNLLFVFSFGLIVSLSAPGARAQEGSLSDMIKSGTVAFDYTFQTKGSSTPFTGSGIALVSGASYRIEGNGLDIRCDGASRWTADPEAGEMVIETAEGEVLDFLSNPALLLGDLYGNFKIEDIPSDGSPAKANLKMQDGSEVDFTITNFRYTPEKKVWTFTKEELEAYPNITDLREE